MGRYQAKKRGEKRKRKLLLVNALSPLVVGNQVVKTEQQLKPSLRN
jgi:hypothetical protein